VSCLGNSGVSKEDIGDTVTLTTSQLLTYPDAPPAILLVGHRHANEPYSVALEVTNETLNILRSEVSKAERYLSMPKITP